MRIVVARVYSFIEAKKAAGEGERGGNKSGEVIRSISSPARMVSRILCEKDDDDDNTT